MTEPMISCPNCKTDIKLTETLAGPLLETTRKQFEQTLATKDKDIAAREKVAKDKEANFIKAQEKLDEKVSGLVENQLKQDRAKITVHAEIKAQQNVAGDLAQKAQELQDMQEALKSRDFKLAEAQKTQVELIKKGRELDDAKREIDLTVEKRVQENLHATRQKARKEAEDEQRLKVMEKEQTIFAMQKQIEVLKRRSEQGSQQLQGEVQELELENLLSTKFPFDIISPVPKGEFGGDVIHQVRGTNGQTAGTILWEFKRTKNWSAPWLVKLRNDQRTAKAEISVIVSHALPKDVETFHMIDGVWVAHPSVALPLAMVLRQSLLDISFARQASEGQQTKTELIYQYLTGPNFKLRVEAIIESFQTMQVDLDRERKVVTKQWAKREQQIERVMGATIGMYGDLQGIAGSSFLEIESLELEALEFENKP